MAALLTRRDGATGWIVFSNPAKHNALTYEMLRALPGALAAFDRDAGVRVIALAGEGDKAFISGADIAEFETERGSIGGEATYAQAVEEANAALLKATKPTLARIRGTCFGAGLGIAISCDLRICADDAQFAVPAARLGLGYSFESTRRLVNVVGQTFAAEILLTARRYSAAEAASMRMVNRVVAAAELEAVAGKTCAAIAQGAPLTIAAAKRAIAESLKDPEARDLRALQAMIDACFASDDYREGRDAFREKRSPVFRSR